MARRDFAKKRNSGSAASRATRSNSKNNRAPSKQPFPWVRSVISLGFLIGFVYLLWQLTSVRPDNGASAPASPAASTPSKADIKSAAKPAPQSTSKAKPTPSNSSGSQSNNSAIPPVEEQSERFDFYEILPESEVDTANVEPYKSTPKSAKPKHTYVLQAGSFQSHQDAEQLRARLILEGLPNVKTRRVTNSNGSIWYQVLTGPYTNRSMLSKAEDRLVSMNIQPLVRQID
ncbi:SPOR domain-containing protein [Amphritea sp. 1_MG-2023]|uniref:SPOR domain-containing protein n=1 Tax=Amphritea sp. 1_MG-2023 TaxID=3062670 RepID=UPI0026E32E06|nr:SPOR domain-containing protein [Amphritea sp. 1_MG-2023]MDO6563029.1 SPOR domain-containing protein [Amphritea sp. 1_MG-2023]